MLWLLVLCSAPAHAKDKVTVGAYVHDVQDLDLRTHSYAVDIYLWFRWSNPQLDPATTVEFMNPYDLWGHTRKTAYEKPVETAPGEYYQVLRTQGRFSNKFPLDDYPFDSQVLVVEFEDSSLGADLLAFESQGVVLNPRLRLPGYQVGQARMSSSAVQYPTNFGDPRTASPAIYGRVRMEIDVVRPKLPYGIKLILPLLCVLLCAALIFFFEVKQVEVRAGIGTTALLALVALQITVVSELPDVDYLLKIDRLYLVGYCAIVLAMGSVVWSTRILQQGDEARARILDRRHARMLGALTTALFVMVLI